MNTSVRINVRVAMNNAIQIFQQLRNQISGLGNQAAGLGTSLSASGTRGASGLEAMNQAGRRLVQTGRTLLYNFTFPLVGAFAILERQALKNSEQFALLTQVYSTANGQSAKFGQTNRQVTSDLNKLDQIMTVLSNTYGIAKDKVTELAVTFGRAGLTGVDLAKSVKNAIVLMAGFQVNTTQATDAVMQLGVSYKLNADQVAVASAVITDASQKTRADVQTLVAGFVKAAPAASLLGIKISTLADYLAVMQQAGFKGAESGTAMNFMFTRLNEATPKAIKLFKSFGLELNSAAYETANGEQRLQMITKAIGGLSDAQRAIAIGDLFGVRQYPKAIALLSDLLSKTGLFVQLQKGQTDSTKLLAEQQNALAIAMDNSQTKFNILKTQLINNFTIIANDLTPALLAITNILVEASRWFAHLGDSAGGRTIQAFIIFAAAVLALAGPIAILVGSIETLVPLMVGAGSVIAAAFSPIGLALMAIAGLAIAFHNQFVSVMESLYNDILYIAKAIYQALQWINPFAHHSPSLVERTRDGIAAILGYWGQLKVIFGIMDQASVAMRGLTSATAAFTAAQDKAALAKQRAAIVKTSGAGAGSAFDAVVASNARLLAQLPVIQAQYTKQAQVVAKAKAALDAANASLDAAQDKLKALQATREDAQAAVDKLGNPEALQSQADSASNMARSLAEAGNTDLAQQFQGMSMHLGDQAKKAGAAKAKLDEIDAAIKKQQAAIDALTAARDKLNDTYDTENEKLQAIKDLYGAVKDEIDANTAALNQMADAAQAAIDAAAAAAKKAAAAAAAGAGDAAFKNAAGGNFAIGGASALPPNLPKGAGGSMDDFLKQLNSDQAKTMQSLFPNPFRMFGKWVTEAKDKISEFKDWLKSLVSPSVPMPTIPGRAVGSPIGGVQSGAAKAVGAVKDLLGQVDWKKIATDAKGAWKSIQDGAQAFVNAVGGPLQDFGSALRDTLGFLVQAGHDLIEIFLKHLGPVLDGFANFWKTNGKQIGQILGFIAAQVIEFGTQILKIVTFVAKLLWPVVKFTLDNIMGIFENLWRAIEGALTFIIQLLTGNFSKAFQGLGDMFIGLGKAIWDALKALGGAVVLALAGLAALVLDELIAGLAEVGPLFVKLGEKVPGWLWDALKLAWKGVVKLVEFMADWLDTVAPGALDAFTNFASKIPGWIWDGITKAWSGAIKLVEYLVTKLGEYEVGAAKAAGDFAGKLPGWLWDGMKAAWSNFWKFEKWLGDKFAEYAPGVAGKAKDFAGKIPGWLWDGLKATWDNFWKFESWLGEKIRGAAKAAMEAAQDLGHNIPSWLWDSLKYAWNKSVDIASWVGDHIIGAAKSAADAAQSVGSRIPSWLWGALKQAWAKAVDIGSFIADQIGGAVKSALNAAFSLGESIVNGIIRGLLSIPGALTSAVTGLLGDAWNAGRHWLDSHSPSKRAARELGAPITQGIALGIRGSASDVSDALVDSLKSAHAQAAALSTSAISLPALQQRVQLIYEGQMSALPSMQAGAVAGGDGGSVTGSGGNTYHTEINVDATKSEQSDPQALAAAIAWKQRTTVGY